jgi:hypothetical protein
MTSDGRARLLVLLLRVAGVITVTAFVAIFLPVSTDPMKYRAIVSYIASMNVLFGVIVFAIDLHAGMPAYWTFGEGPPITAFGIVIAYLNSKSRS